MIARSRLQEPFSVESSTCILETARSAPAELCKHLSRLRAYCRLQARSRLLQMRKSRAHIAYSGQQRADIKLGSRELRLDPDGLLIFLDRRVDLSLRG
jgi:hypothetical protein